MWYDGCRYVGGNDNYNECLCIKNRCETMNVNKVITILNINWKSKNKKMYDHVSIKNMKQINTKIKINKSVIYFHLFEQRRNMPLIL